ncbi:aldehyde dehydrogenase family protein [Actinomycetospora endophytica]|uniref:Aldehyde dehydrogenase family protein n=1 Tax=Actinomycetospora endophytica TaxID=2291215 RepID=A0ABS8PI91_9PSEU|nr:aldehyde dehydrogenase family protein [Actinomycetospora endophytica]MCD2197647.1 aldehyde dehydrogenase family protein [Actinomycetospora endophytica]
METVPHAGEVLVGGRWQEATGEPYAIVSPAGEQPVAEVVLPSEKDAENALEAADQVGRRTWARLPVADRIAACRRFCTAMEARLDEIGRLWALEAGMPVRYSRTLHRFGAVGSWNAALECAADALRDDVRPSPLGETIVRREPAGVVAAVMAFNGPLVTTATKVVPALLAGCPVVVKAAPESQLVMRVVAECAEATLPEGTLSVLCADADVGRALAGDPRVDMVSLTGGRRAALEILDATKARFARTHLELGGKSPALILDDAPLDAVLKSLVPGATGGAGQVCALLSRVLVSEKRADELVEKLAGALGALTIGDPLDPDTRIGPMINAAGVDRAEAFVERARAAGATVGTGGRRREGPGFFYEPTLVTGLARDADLARNEVFGPVTAVQTFTDVDDGIALANDTSYGLAATVYTADRDVALDAASRIEAGSVAINTFGPTVTAPFGGRKGSGWGRETGPEGIHEFTELKQIVLGPGV